MGRVADAPFWQGCSSSPPSPSASTRETHHRLCRCARKLLGLLFKGWLLPVQVNGPCSPGEPLPTWGLRPCREPAGGRGPQNTRGCEVRGFQCPRGLCPRRCGPDPEPAWRSSRSPPGHAHATARGSALDALHPDVPGPLPQSDFSLQPPVVDLQQRQSLCLPSQRNR